MGKLHFRHALLREGWAEDVLIETDEAGDIVSAHGSTPRSDGAPCGGAALPPLPNPHTHAM